MITIISKTINPKVINVLLSVLLKYDENEEVDNKIGDRTYLKIITKIDIDNPGPAFNSFGINERDNNPNIKGIKQIKRICFG